MSSTIETTFAEQDEDVNSEIVVRPPNLQDVEGLASLFSEMQRHYQRPVPYAQALAAARIACQPPVAAFDPRVLLATLDGVVVGSIVMNVSFPAYELTQSLYIRDLYVAASARRAGVGRMLVNAAARYTYANGFSALDWTTDAENVGARAMYESCGARLLSRIYYRLAREDMVA
ncbi:MAG TPA: GNAT family N-acetyltransferase [Rhodopila sp.]|uniref:GNAT family N-acetyltransferase n=1 Tax=Rhodopila sp. TaxID=2480087 RepID=UPI002C70EDF8|nr:GNAT family N-acetyltransferase [Rhodopila sp.]HVY13842.1 GNAT family N-acetyltransferase [Rhodopila sp.]